VQAEPSRIALFAFLLDARKLRWRWWRTEGEQIAPLEASRTQHVGGAAPDTAAEQHPPVAALADRQGWIAITSRMHGTGASRLPSAPAGAAGVHDSGNGRGVHGRASRFMPASFFLL
jgi:hypothetical protein